jgi:hypothetical protein
MSSKEFEGDAGAPLPDFSTGQIRLDTVAPALGVSSRQQPDYLDYDQKGRGVVVTMFANTGVSYLLGIVGGGLYGFQKGISTTPSSKFKVQVNSVLNHCGRYGSKAGNTLAVFAVMYSLYEGVLDQVSTVYFFFEVQKLSRSFPRNRCISFILSSLSSSTHFSRRVFLFFNISLTWSNILASILFLHL